MLVVGRGVGDAVDRPVRTLEAVAGLGLLAHDVEDGVDELRALRVVALGPVVARARLPEHEVVCIWGGGEGGSSRWVG